MQTTAVVMERPGETTLRTVQLCAPQPADVVVDIAWSGISTGTERLLWSGRMPDFPGMGYPLVPGYESVGQVIQAGDASDRQVGELVFVAGARCFGDVRGLFGGAAARLVVPGARALPIDAAMGEQGTLLALAATAFHAIAGGAAPQLIVGHGVLGRLLARITVALGHAAPTVWETDGARHGGADGYQVTTPDADPRRDYSAILDASGDAAILNQLVGRLARGGEIVLAGFYPGDVSFAFAPAFMREVRLRCAAEWQPDDLAGVRRLLRERSLSLAGLITHRSPAAEASSAYQTAFGDPACLKMVLDWSDAHE